MANFLKSLFVKGVEIDPAGAASDQVLKYNGTKFVPGTASTVGSIDDLSDVAITSPANGEILKYNSSTSLWTNASAGASGGSTITSSATAPVSPSAGDLWFNTTTGSSYIYYNSAWVELGGGSMSPYQATSSTRPSSPWTGQLAYETDTQLLIMYNGSAWVEINSALTKAPRGVMALSVVTSNITSNSNNEVTRTSVTWTAVANRYYKITWVEGKVDNGVNASVNNHYLRTTTTGGTIIANTLIYYPSSSLQQGSVCSCVKTFSAGTQTVFARVVSNAGTDTTWKASATEPAYLLVEDIGGV